ncbi:uncharacterized protein B0T15DRAFT_286746 [Chaetomium strumarium]|uniref:Uncharacterized protein n=1 Tax=Chaetomium strumarium TaxID=1170767 RepID=A0AAJ0GL42_9PEZI|nr:hypothetical protein B0T15DRAFT_286746 [Chaetomium strumarium]
MSRVSLTRALLAPPMRRGSLLGRPLRLAVGARSVSSVAEPSFWKSLVPKPLRSRSTTGLEKRPKTKQGWNPATFFILMSLFIGSMSIQMIALKRDYGNFMRRTDVRIGLLREVVEKLQRGEKVDVEQALGTGDPVRELVWEEVLKDIERGESAKNQQKKQPETAPAPNPEPNAPPAPETARAPVQSTLASQGFF